MTLQNLWWLAQLLTNTFVCLLLTEQVRAYCSADKVIHGINVPDNQQSNSCHHKQEQPYNLINNIGLGVT